MLLERREGRWGDPSFPTILVRGYVYVYPRIGFTYFVEESREKKRIDYLVSHLWPKTWWQSSHGCTCMDNTFNKKGGRHKKEDNNRIGDKSS